MLPQSTCYYATVSFSDSKQEIALNSDESFELRKFDETEQPSGGASAVRQRAICKLIHALKSCDKATGGD